MGGMLLVPLSANRRGCHPCRAGKFRLDWAKECLALLRKGLPCRAAGATRSERGVLLRCRHRQPAAMAIIASCVGVGAAFRGLENFRANPVPIWTQLWQASVQNDGDENWLPSCN